MTLAEPRDNNSQVRQQMSNSHVNPQFKSIVYQQKNAKYRKCLWHTMTCPNEPIKAHAVQNRQVLDRIAEDGHVVMVRPDIKEDEIRIHFDKIGRNIATTFTGLCSQHDSELFRPIETQPPDPTNPEHQFLVAYRSVLKGLHSSLHAGAMVQQAFTKGVELGELSEDGEEMLMATMQIASAMQFFNVAQFYHDVYRSAQWDRVRHETLLLSLIRPPVAATGVVLPTEAEHRYSSDCPHLLAFNVFPLGKSLYLQFSWHPDSEAAMRPTIEPILQAIGDYQLYLLSKLILKYTETFVIRPSTYEGFANKQLEAIERYFVANSCGNRQDWDDKQLFLFGRIDA